MLSILVDLSNVVITAYKLSFPKLHIAVGIALDCKVLNEHARLASTSCVLNVRCSCTLNAPNGDQMVSDHYFNKYLLQGFHMLIGIVKDKNLIDFGFTWLKVQVILVT